MHYRMLEYTKALQSTVLKPSFQTNMIVLTLNAADHSHVAAGGDIESYKVLILDLLIK